MADTRIRVLHVITDSNFGGAGRYLVTLLNRPEYTDSVSAEIACPEGLLWDRLSSMHVARNKLPGGDRSLDLGQLLPLISMIVRGRYDIVHTHASLTARIAARLVPGTRIVFTKHTMGGAGVEGGVYTTLQKLLTDRVICPSKAVLDQLVRSGLDPSLLDLVYNGVEIPDQPQAAPRCVLVEGGAFRILSTGRLEKEKGHEYLIQAMPRVLRRYPAARLQIAGDGSLKSVLESLAQDTGVGKSVEFLGFREDISSLLQQADLFVLPSLAEALGISLLEAMAAGVPCVASDVGGIHEILIPGENGLIAPPRDADRLAVTILMALDDKELCSRLVESAKRTVRAKFSSRSQALGTVECYRKAMG
jgi:glycosyltransferase involved in cell wall biosynthesis